MKKKILAIVMVAAMAASMAACGSKTSEQPKQDASAATEQGSTSGAKYKIGVCQLVEHAALDAATQGFCDTLKEKLGDDVEIDVKNAQGESTNCATICTTFVSDGVDLILGNATGALQAASAATADIPILGTSITDYSSALGLKEFNGTTGMNVSGTSDLAPIDQQEDMILELVPDVKSVGILYCSAEPNSLYQVDQMIKYLEEDNIAYKTYAATDGNDIQSVVTTACAENDCLYVQTDNTMANGVDIMKNVMIPAKIPMIAGEAGICKAGIATLSISYYDLGCQTAEMAYDILVNGADVKTMEVQTAPKVTKMYNKENCEALGIEIPEGYEELPTE